ncbi:hypothetical protein [Gimesia chilikensis]|nr:hypothetical protein [Gimesia chilikensis]
MANSDHWVNIDGFVGGMFDLHDPTSSTTLDVTQGRLKRPAD